MRKHAFAVGEYYHIYNRGVDKRAIVEDQNDLKRFTVSLNLFNTTDPIGSMYELSFKKEPLGSRTTKSAKLVSIITFCINPNHFHILLTPLIDKGVEKFMQRLGGYTRYFNDKYQRSGALFQGKFKSKHIPNNEYLLHVSAYINMNNRDLLGIPTTKLSASGYDSYIHKNFRSPDAISCDSDIILQQFDTMQSYVSFCKKSWHYTQELKELHKTDLDFLPPLIS